MDMRNPRTTPIRVGILGAGGLGLAAVRLLAMKQEMRLVAVVDSKGFAFDADGLDTDAVIHASEAEGTVAETPRTGMRSNDPIGELIHRGDSLDGIFLAVPNLPNDFIPHIVEPFAKRGYRGVMVDALKRTQAVELLLKMDDLLHRSEITYVVGAGATPGLLTAAANLASMSFAAVESVEIVFGVGITNWMAYRGTIREDIAHLPGFDVERVAKMTDEEVESELQRRNGILELVNMEHADDVILELAGVVDRSKVTVSGIVDTRNAKKPVSTNVKITGITFEGKRSSHTFTLGDETSMKANVLGPVFGYMKTAIWMHGLGAYGIFSCANLMPQFVR